MPRAKVQGGEAAALLGALLLRGNGAAGQEDGVPRCGQPGHAALSGEPQGPSAGKPDPRPGPGIPAPLCSPRMHHGETWGHSVPLLDLNSFTPRGSGGGEGGEACGPEMPGSGSQEWAGRQRAGRRASVLPGAQAGCADSLFSIWK